MAKASVPEVEVVVGLDFGTSMTKVVVAAPFEGEGLHYAVEFSKDRGVKRYLQPTVLYVDQSDKNYKLSKFKGAKAKSNLKLNFVNWAENSEDDTCLESAVNVVIYLALIIKKAQKFFEKKSQRDLGRMEFKWMLNLGIPAAALRTGRLKKSFETAALVAWELAQSDKLNSKLAKDVWEKETRVELKPAGTHRERINIYPELAAQTTGFILSKYGHDGLYLMIDVGAGTMDIALFHASAITGTPVINFYTGSVEFLGCLELFKERREAIRKRKKNMSWGENLIRANIGELPFDRVPVNEDEDQCFLEKCRNGVYKQIGLTKAAGFFDGRATNLRDNGLSYFLCGGGSGMEIYKSIPGAIKPHIEQVYHFAGFRAMVLKAPRNLTAKCGKDYHRVSVAYGLSMHFLNLPVTEGFVDALINPQENQRDNHDEGRRKCRTTECPASPVPGGDFCYSCGGT